jgi:hypothetical protein
MAYFEAGTDVPINLASMELISSGNRELLCMLTISVTDHCGSTIDAAYESLNRSSESLVHWRWAHMSVVAPGTYQVDTPIGFAELLPLLLGAIRCRSASDAVGDTRLGHSRQGFFIGIRCQGRASCSGGQRERCTACTNIS